MLDALALVGITINAISVISSICVICLYFLLRRRCPRIMDRVSLRLSVSLSAADLFYSLAQFWGAFNTRTEPGCTLSAVAYIFTLLVSIFLYACMAFNLQYVFLTKRRGKYEPEKWYYIISFVLATGLSVAIGLSGELGWESYSDCCWFKDLKRRSAFLWGILTIYLWVVLVIIYSLGVVTIVLITLGTEQYWLRKTISESKKSIENNRGAAYVATTAQREVMDSVATQRRRQRIREVRSLILRISLYPLIPFLTQTGTVTMTIWAYSETKLPFWIILVAWVGASSQGWLNFLAFCCDPAVIKANRELKEDLKEYLNVYFYKKDTFKMDSFPSGLHATTNQNPRHFSVASQGSKSSRNEARGVSLEPVPFNGQESDIDVGIIQTTPSQGLLSEHDFSPLEAFGSLDVDNACLMIPNSTESHLLWQSKSSIEVQLEPVTIKSAHASSKSFSGPTLPRNSSANIWYATSNEPSEYIPPSVRLSETNNPVDDILIDNHVYMAARMDSPTTSLNEDQKWSFL